MAAAILLVDREARWRREVARGLRPYLVRVCEAGDARQARLVLSERALDFIALDTGVLSVEQLVIVLTQQGQRRRPMLVVTTEGQRYSVAVAALRAQALDVFERPVAPREMIARIAKALESSIASPHFLSRRLDRYIQENCTNRHLDLMITSKALRISSSYASALLRNGSWRGFRSRVAFHRTQMARSLLRATDEPLYTIAERCGFASASRLSETFSRVVGMPPRKYREGARTLTAD